VGAQLISSLPGNTHRTDQPQTPAHHRRSQPVRPPQPWHDLQPVSPARHRRGV